MARRRRTRAIYAGRTDPLSGLPLAVLLDTPDFVRSPTAMSARLADHRRCQQLRGIELTKGKPLEPRLLSACRALQLRASDVPELDVDAVGATVVRTGGQPLGQLAA